MNHPLTKSEMNTFLDITFLFSSSSDLETLSSEFLRLLGKLIPYERAVNLFFHAPSQSMIPLTQIRCGKGFTDDYIGKYQAMDYLGWLIYQSTADGMRDSDILTLDEKRATVFYKSFMRKYDIEHRLVFTAESEKGEPLCAVMLFRSAAFEDFSERDLWFARATRKHFAAAVKNALRLERLSRSAELAQKVRSLITEAVFVLTPEMDIREPNEQADKLMKALRQKEGERDAFFNVLRTACETLQRTSYVTNGARREYQKAQEMSVTANVYRGTAKIGLFPISAFAQRFPHEFVVVYSDAPTGRHLHEEWLHLVWAGAQKERKDKFLSALRRQCGITRQESNLLGLALDGMGNRKIAEASHISLFTVKSHFHNIYAKLGIGSRRELFLLYMNDDVAEEARQEPLRGAEDGSADF
ncbi:MAG: helix-turn-helix transcriptional regulator [Clostridiales Family XIII bacterium]|nr:helix-turn-helix transcriptional regulator [Clostridiales Family XIII bacterium]